jgi:hypothetical protein
MKYWPECPAQAAKAQINYQVETHPNKHCVTLHLDTELPFQWWGSDYEQTFVETRGGHVGHYLSVCPFEKKAIPAYLAGFFNITGLLSISARRYELQIVKGNAFAWDAVLPAIISHVMTWLNASAAVLLLTEEDTVAADTDVDEVWDLDEVIELNPDPECITPIVQPDVASEEPAAPSEEVIPFAEAVDDTTATMLVTTSPPPGSPEQQMHELLELQLPAGAKVAAVIHDSVIVDVPEGTYGPAASRVVETVLEFLTAHTGPAQFIEINPGPKCQPAELCIEYKPMEAGVALPQVEVVAPVVNQAWLPLPDELREYSYADGSCIWRSQDDPTKYVARTTVGGLLFKDGVKMYFDTPELAAQELLQRECGPYRADPPAGSQPEPGSDNKEEKITEADCALLAELEAPVEPKEEPKEEPVAGEMVVWGAWYPRIVPDVRSLQYPDGSRIVGSCYAPKWFMELPNGSAIYDSENGGLLYVSDLHDAARHLYSLGVGPYADAPPTNAVRVLDVLDVAPNTNRITYCGPVCDVAGSKPVTPVSPIVTLEDQLAVPADGLVHDVPGNGLVLIPFASTMADDLENVKVWLPELLDGGFKYPDGARICPAIEKHKWVVALPAELCLTPSNIFAQVPLDGIRYFDSVLDAARALTMLGYGPGAHPDPTVRIWLPAPDNRTDRNYADGSAVWHIPGVGYLARPGSGIIRNKNAGFRYTKTAEAAAELLAMRGCGPAVCFNCELPDLVAGQYKFKDGSRVRRSRLDYTKWVAENSHGYAITDDDHKAMMHDTPELAAKSLRDRGYGPAVA